MTIWEIRNDKKVGFMLENVIRANAMPPGAHVHFTPGEIMTMLAFTTSTAAPV